MSRRVRTHAKPARPKAQDELIEISPHTYLFTPAWAIKAKAKSR